MPVEFDPEKVIEWGKYFGLGLKKIHEQGYTVGNPERWRFRNK